MMTGAELKVWRKKNRYTQKTLSEELDISRQTIMAWESSEKPLPRLTQLALAALEHVPSYRLVDGVTQTASQHVEQRARAAHVKA